MTELEITLQQLIQMMDGMKSVVKVSPTFHGQMKQINALLGNDTTAIVSPILNFQIKSANTPITFDANKSGLTKLLEDWSKNVNSGLNIDIPKGLFQFGEQYYRERLSSSLIVVKLRWKKVDGVLLPMRMWILNGSSIYVENETKSINDNKYYLGKPGDRNQLENIYIDNDGEGDETVIVRKPYTQWYEKYPSPYLVQRGALEYAILKTLVMQKQKEMVHAVFPYYLQLKVGSAERMMKTNMMPGAQDLEAMKTKFQELKSGYDVQQWAKGIVAATPYDVEINEMIPDFNKILDEKILKGVDRNLLNAMGMIELKGISSTREEAILNPQVLINETNDAVNDYVDLMKTIVELIKEKNSNLYKMNDEVSVQPGIIKGFLTEKDKEMIRSWFDRGLIGMKSALENTTGLLFETQVKERKVEIKEGYDLQLFPRVVQNQENSLNEPVNEDVPADKKKNSPESKNFKNASQIQEDLNKIEEFEENKLLEALEKNIEEQLGEYLEAPYSSPNELPDSVKDNMTIGLQRIFMQVVNNSLKNGDSEEVSFKKAWATISKVAHKNKSGKWVPNKT